MYFDTQLKVACMKFFEEFQKADHEQNEIYCTVLYFIHSAPHLSMLYLNWTDLQTHEKFALNYQIEQSLPKNGKNIYLPVIRAFEYWDMIQDTCGAPGFNCNPLNTELSEETDRDIVKLLLVMEKTINQINIKSKLMQELSSYRDTRNILYSYKWRIICKNINKTRSHFTNKKDNSERSEEETYVSDLNGCGDTTWFSDIE